MNDAIDPSSRSAVEDIIEYIERHHDGRVEEVWVEGDVGGTVAEVTFRL